jgi:hypothetical protein
MPDEVSQALAANADADRRWGGRAPIMLGVVGHRNIDTKNKKLAAALKKQCALLRGRYKHSPFVILSALAEGADRLMANIALKELQAELIAVLPMPEGEYERDFETAESKAEFRSLLKRALCVKIAPAPPGQASWASEGEPRNERYARAGAIIVDHVQVLFAIWDGEPARGTGGTADQVAWFKRGDSPAAYSLHRDAISPLDPLEPGLLIRVDPATAQVRIINCPPFEGRQQSGAKSNIRSILARTNRYNCDVLRHHSLVAGNRSLAAESTGETHDLAITAGVHRASDALSLHFAEKARNSDTIVYSLALGAVLIFNFVSSKEAAPWIYLGITAIMAVLAARVWFWSIDNRFLEYRCLAEAARTLFFWRIAGVRRSLWITCLSRQLGAMHWVRHAVRAIEFCQDCPRPAAQHSIRSDSDGLHIAERFWVSHQKDWFKKKELEHLKRSKFWKTVSRLAIGASFVTAIILAALTAIPGGNGQTLWDVWVNGDLSGDLWQAALGLFAGGGVAARGFLSRRAHLELAKQYASQRLIFENASRMLDKIKGEMKPEWTATTILEKLGQEALQEQAEWLWLRHTRPFEVPAA